MRIKHYLLFFFFSLLFLFYPGDSYYFNIFAYNRSLFRQKDEKMLLKNDLIPYLKLPYYPEVSAEGVYVIDLTSFTPIWEKNADQQFFPASTTKMITALVTMDVYKPDDILTVKRNMTEGQLMGLVENEQITVENLLYGLLVHSGNDAAYALADNYGFDQFVKLMNEKAKALKMEKSYFKNPAGLDDFNQQTTPHDLALAAREILKNSLLKNIVATKEITISDIDFKYFHRLANVNKLLGEIQGIGGLKTGYTENAKENLISFYKKNGHQFIVIVLKSDDRFADTINIVKWIDEDVDYLTP